MFLNTHGQAHYVDLSGRTVDALAVIDKDKANILAAYLGIHGHPPDLSLEEIGRRIQPRPLTKQAVYQHIVGAGKKLRTHFDMHSIVKTYFTMIGEMPWED
jgi:hypothetical protein